MFASTNSILKHHDIIVYLETANDWVHLGSFVEKLLERTKVNLCFLLSSDMSCISDTQSRFPKRTSHFNIGDGLFRSFIFPQLSADVLIMTLTDLGSPRLRKSKSVHNYVYLFHSITSTHMCYPASAFDNYDTIFCVGPHHIREIRHREKTQNLNSKRLIEFGHSRIENLRNYTQEETKKRNLKRIAIAPSWGPSSCIEQLSEEFYLNLINSGFSLYVRLHTMSKGRRRYFSANLEHLASRYKSLDLDYSHLDDRALLECSLMISDWSGAATEFAFGFKRPVIFIDTPRKIRNREYLSSGMTPIEVEIRSKIGRVIEPTQVAGIGNWLRDYILSCDKKAIRQKIDQEYQKNVFSSEPSWETGINTLAEIHGYKFLF